MRSPRWLALALAILAVGPAGAPLARATVPLASVYYVAPSGSDANPGARDRPWRTIQHAAETLTAGQTVYIRTGTYRERVRPSNSGADGAPITYAAYPSEMPVLDGATVTLPDDLHGLFEIAERSHIRVIGLRVINAGPHDNNAGILVDRSRNIVLEGNHTVDTISSGIGVWASQHVTVTRNIIERACLRIWQECLSVAETENFAVTGNVVYDCQEEGICVKDASAHGEVCGNHIHHVGSTGLYVDAWERYTHDILVCRNVVHDVSDNGMALASEQGGTLEDVRLHNNVVYSNRFVGISISMNGVGGPIRDVAIVNNTLFDNGGEWGGGIVVDNRNARGVLIRNNLVAGNRTFGIAHGAGLPPSELTVDHNLTDACLDDADEICGGGQVAVGDPRYTNPTGGDFRLRPGSAAIDVGSADAVPTNDWDGFHRPQDGDGDGYAVHDLGAYERMPQAPRLYLPGVRRQ